MAYQFDAGSGELISYGMHSQLYLPLAMSIGFWVKLKTAFSNGASNPDQFLVGDNFPPVMVKIVTNNSHPEYGYGVTCEHQQGGSFTFGVTCYPGQVNQAYALAANTWM